MTQVNTEQFLQQWIKIKTLFDSLGQLPMIEKDFERYEIGEEGVTLVTGTWYNGNGTDYGEYLITWDEMNMPAKYFIGKKIRETEAAKLRKKCN